MTDTFGIMVIGDEILNGRRRDRHFEALGSMLRERGFGVHLVRRNLVRHRGAAIRIADLDVRAVAADPDGDLFVVGTQPELVRGVLSRNARILKEAGVVVLISGHCDERGSEEYNLALGERRARVTSDYLTSLGVCAGQLDVISYGEERPAEVGTGEEAWAKNRRAQFVRRRD